MHKLFFFNTDEIPTGVVASTARKGSEWSNKVGVGDIVAVYTVGEPDHPTGHSVVVAKEYLAYLDVLENASHSTVGYGTGARQRPALYDTLHRAYGSLDHEDLFTVLHLLPLNNTEAAANDEIKELAKKVTSEIIEDARASVKQARSIAFDAQTRADAVYEAGMNAVLAFAEQLADENARAQTLEAQLKAALAPDEVDSRRVIDAGVNAAAAHLAAHGEGAFIRAVEQVDSVGDVTRIIRTEF